MDTKQQLLPSRPMKCLQNPCNSFYVLTVSNNGNLLAAGDFDGNVFLYQNFNLVKKFSAHQKYVITLQFSKSGNQLASGSADKNVVLITIKKEEFIVKTLQDNSAYIMKVGFSENEKFLITASSDKTLQIYDTKTYQKIQMITYNCALNFADFIGCTQIILYGTYGQVEILNFNRLHKKTKIKPMNFFIKRASLHKGMEIQQLFLLNGSKTAKIFLYNLIFFKQIRRFDSESDLETLDICFKDSKLVVTKSENIEIWDWVTATLLGILETSASIGSSMLSNDQKLYAISRSEIKIWTIGGK